MRIFRLVFFFSGALPPSFLSPAPLLPPRSSISDWRFACVCVCRFSSRIDTSTALRQEKEEGRVVRVGVGVAGRDYYYAAFLSKKVGREGKEEEGGETLLAGGGSKLY